jgi:uncharacterized membrane protein
VAILGRRFDPTSQLFKSKEIPMPFARIDLAKGKSTDYRAAVAEVVYLSGVNYFDRVAPTIMAT